MNAEAKIVLEKSALIQSMALEVFKMGMFTMEKKVFYINNEILSLFNE